MLDLFKENFIKYNYFVFVRLKLQCYRSNCGFNITYLVWVSMWNYIAIFFSLLYHYNKIYVSVWNVLIAILSSLGYLLIPK